MRRMPSAHTFIQAHAAHPDWRQALSQCAARVREQVLARSGASAEHDAGVPPAFTLGLCYFSDRYAADAESIVEALHRQWPGVGWVGSVAVGVAASGVEFIDRPAISLMLTDLPANSFRVFSGRRPLNESNGFRAHTALVHADGQTPELAELLQEMSERLATGYLFGGLASSRGRSLHVADEVLDGGLSGVAFDASVQLVSRVTQGCLPFGPARRVTEAEKNLVMRLDGEPALDMLVRDLGGKPGAPLHQVAGTLGQTLVGLSQPGEDTLSRPGQFGADVRVRHLIGLEPNRGFLSIADVAEAGMLLTFCRRDPEAARRDLVRIATEIREAVEGDGEPGSGGRRMTGAVYVSCAGRGGPHFGAADAELQIVRRALGDVPLVGFFAGGEVARNHLYGYTGVLTVFTEAA